MGPTTARTTFSVGPDREDDVALITVVGPLGEDAVLTCRSTVDRVLQLRPGGVVVDLHAATLEDFGVGVLSLLHRYLARHGTELVLAAPPPVAAAMLPALHVHGMMTVRTVEAAVAAIGRRRAVSDGRG
jgi:hypothetical protein